MESVSEMSTGNSILTCTYSVSVEAMTLCYYRFSAVVACIFKENV